MKTYLHAFFMCQSMFCAIPAPQVWDEKARDKMLLFLPVVGLELGLIWWGLSCICRMLPELMAALVLSMYPYLATGFLHLDGFMDVTDALRSYRSLERRREILKDSHVGSFAVIGIVILLLSQFVCFASMKGTADCRVLLFIPAVSRCCSALAVTVLKHITAQLFLLAAMWQVVTSLQIPMWKCMWKRILMSLETLWNMCLILTLAQVSMRILLLRSPLAVM